MSVPDGIDLGRHADRSGIGAGVLGKRASRVALAAVPSVALVDVFARRPSTAKAAAVLETDGSIGFITRVG